MTGWYTHIYVYLKMQSFLPKIIYNIIAILIKRITQQADPRIHMEDTKDEI